MANALSIIMLFMFAAVFIWTAMRLLRSFRALKEGKQDVAQFDAALKKMMTRQAAEQDDDMAFADMFVGRLN